MQRSRLGRMAYGFDVVAIRADDERGKIIGMILGPQPRCTVVNASSRKSSMIKALDLLAIFCCKRDVEWRGFHRTQEQNQRSIAL